jgi:hypothetical protein
MRTRSGRALTHRKCSPFACRHRGTGIWGPESRARIQGQNAGPESGPGTSKPDLSVPVLFQSMHIFVN